MKIISKEILPRKEQMAGKNTSGHYQTPKHKGLSKSLSKPIKIGESSTPLKKGKDKKDFQLRELKVIKEAPAKKKK